MLCKVSLYSFVCRSYVSVYVGKVWLFISLCPKQMPLFCLRFRWLKHALRSNCFNQLPPQTSNKTPTLLACIKYSRRKLTEVQQTTATSNQQLTTNKQQQNNVKGFDACAKWPIWLAFWLSGMDGAGVFGSDYRHYFCILSTWKLSGKINHFH